MVDCRRVRRVAVVLGNLGDGDDEEAQVFVGMLVDLLLDEVS